jgi:hypothetical protein
MIKPIAIDSFISLFMKLETDTNILQGEILELIKEDNNKCILCFSNNSSKIKDKLLKFNVLIKQLIELNHILLRKNLITENNFTINCLKINTMQDVLMKNNYIEDLELLQDNKNIYDMQNIR